jgi:hypothetical protein
MVRAEVTASAGFRVTGLFQGEFMGSMTTVAPFLNDVATLTEGGTDFLRNGQVFALNPHPVPADRVTAFLELRQLLRVAFPAFLRKDHGLLLGGDLVINMAGHTVNSSLGVLGFHPGLKKAWRYPLVTFHTEPGV